MSVINAILTPLFDGLLYPFRAVHPIVGVIFVALVAAIFMLVVFKRTSDQRALAYAKRKIQGFLFEIRLFNDDPRAILRAQSEIFWNALGYLKLSLVPMVWILPPLLLAIAQLQSHYGYQAPKPGETFVVEARLTEAAATALGLRRPNAVLQSNGDGLAVQSPAVWMPTERRLAWRVGLHSPGNYELTLSLDGAKATKSFDARPQIVRRSPLKVRSGWLDQLLYPAESLLPGDGPFLSVGVSLQEAEVSIPGLGWNIHWTTVFLIFSLVFALALKGTFRTTI